MLKTMHHNHLKTNNSMEKEDYNEDSLPILVFLHREACLSATTSFFSIGSPSKMALAIAASAARMLPLKVTV